MMGKETAYRNMRSTIEGIEGIQSTWVPIEMDPPERIAHIPPISKNHSLKYGLVARQRVRALERKGLSFDAAFFNHILPALFLREFRSRVPSVDAMDVTPASLRRDGGAYYQKPRSNGLWGISRLKHRYAASLLNEAKVLLPQSEYARRSLLNDYGVSGDRIRVLAPGVDLHSWPGVDRMGKENPSDRSMVVLFVGGDFLRKGGDLLLRVAMQEEFRDVEFHVVTKSYVGPELQNVHIHSDVSANSAPLRRLYESADVFVLPTRADFAPTNSICEAMAMSLPIVSCGVGGIEEIVSENETGFLIPREDERSLSERLRILLRNPQLRARLGMNARAFAERHFDSSKNARQIVEHLAAAAKSKQHILA